MCNNVYLAFKTISRPEFQPQLCTVGDKDSTVFLYNNVFAHIRYICTMEYYWYFMSKHVTLIKLQ